MRGRKEEAVQHSTSFIRKNFSTPNYMDSLDLEPVLRPARSEQDLADMNSLGMFTRRSSFADVPYLALPGINSRVSYTASQHSMASDMQEHFLRDVTLMPSCTPALLKATFTALLTAFQFGYNNGNMNTQAGVMRAALSLPTHGDDGAPVPSNDSIWGFCVSCFCLGALVGCNASGQLADRWGRKHFLLVNNLLFIAGGLMEALSCVPSCRCAGTGQGLAMGNLVWGTGAPLVQQPVVYGACVCSARVLTLIAGRVISGIACGGATVVVPIYLGEISPPQLRGSLGTAFQLTMVAAILCGQLFGLEMFLGTPSLWPVMLALVCIPAVLQLLLQSWLLESPRWFVMAGMEVPAEDVLMQLRDTPIDDPQLQEELFCMVEACSAPQLGRHRQGAHADEGAHLGALNGARAGAGDRSRSLCAMLGDRTLRLPMLLTVGLMFLQQFSGINNAFNYSSIFLAQNHLDSRTVVWVTVAMNVGNVLVTALSVCLMDVAGRRLLVLVSVGAMVASTALLTVALSMPGHSWTASLVILAVFCFVASFGIGLGPIPWLLPAEVFGMHERAGAIGFAASINWLANFAAAQIFLPLSSVLGGFSFLPFGVVLCFGFFFTALYLPETRGKSLEQIRAELRHS